MANSVDPDQTTFALTCLSKYLEIFDERTNFQAKQLPFSYLPPFSQLLNGRNQSEQILSFNL